MKRVYLAIDIGASSGRVMAGLFDGKKLSLEELHRFPNHGHQVLGHYHWNILSLFAEIRAGLAKAAVQHGRALVSAGVDTWGVDYGYVDRRGQLLGLPFQYRDARTEGMEELACRRVPRARLYGTTGIQFLFFNTLLQVLSEVKSGSSALKEAHRLLFTPDLLHYWMSGVQANEYTMASTSQMLDARSRKWATGMLKDLGIPTGMLGPIVKPGTVLGELLPELKKETGIRALKIVTPASHDTASAVAAVPAQGRDHVYLSSGTWSLMGIECDKPLLTPEAQALNFTNEGGVDGTIRLLKNISGLWLTQECRRIWSERGATYDFLQIAELARNARPFAAVIDPDAREFATPGDMPARIRAFVKNSGQRLPSGHGAIARTVYEGLALRYRDVFEKLCRLTGRDYDTLHIVGGGSKNVFLCQLTADAIQRPVLAGPDEATAIGNMLVQMVASGEVSSIAEGRELVRRSFPATVYEPSRGPGWDEAIVRFEKVQAS